MRFAGVGLARPPGVADPWGPESAGGLDPKKRVTRFFTLTL